MMGYGKPNDVDEYEPTEAWPTTDRFGDIVLVTVGVWGNPDAWVDCPPRDLIVDPDGMARHEGDDRV